MPRMAIMWPMFATPPPTAHLPGCPFVATFVAAAAAAVGALGFRPQKLRLSSGCLSVRQEFLWLAFGLYICECAYVCVRAINLSLVIIVLIVSLAQCLCFNVVSPPKLRFAFIYFFVAVLSSFYVLHMAA